MIVICSSQFLISTNILFIVFLTKRKAFMSLLTLFNTICHYWHINLTGFKNKQRNALLKSNFTSMYVLLKISNLHLTCISYQKCTHGYCQWVCVKTQVSRSLDLWTDYKTVLGFCLFSFVVHSLWHLLIFYLKYF